MCTAAPQRQWATAHWVALGNTEEGLRIDVYGVKGRGREGDKPYDHRTGRGWVKPRKGSYHDAIHVKKTRVNLMLVETTGAISPRSLQVIGFHARRARGKHGRDGTRYGRSRASATNFYTHHAQRISMAAAIGDVAGIHKRITIAKQDRRAQCRESCRGLPTKAAPRHGRD